jgi:hypothetical protein
MFLCSLFSMILWCLKTAAKHFWRPTACREELQINVLPFRAAHLEMTVRWSWAMSFPVGEITSHFRTSFDCGCRIGSAFSTFAAATVAPHCQAQCQIAPTHGNQHQHIQDGEGATAQVGSTFRISQFLADAKLESYHKLTRNRPRRSPQSPPICNECILQLLRPPRI